MKVEDAVEGTKVEVNHVYVIPPNVNMTIVNGVKHNADDKAMWDGGEILDPNNGKTYKVRMTPIDGGKQLEVRGYIGLAAFGRTQTWIRVE